MAYDLEEQEQIETLKSWWAKFGNLVTWLLIAGLAAYSGWSAWNYYQRNQADLQRSYRAMAGKVRARLGLIGWARFRLYARRVLRETSTA